jgi:hypothetical protein
MSSTYSFAKITSSSSSFYFATGIAPGGCAVSVAFFSDFGDLPSLVDTPLSDLGFCVGYHYDDLAPIASGSGPAEACQEDNYIVIDDPCYGAVAWSPDTFFFEESFPDDGASYIIPSTCELQEINNTLDLNSYVCEGGSIVRGVKKDGKCRWENSTLLCNDCTPQYAPLACSSLLGEHPNAPKKDDVVSAAGEDCLVTCLMIIGAILAAGAVHGLII